MTPGYGTILRRHLALVLVVGAAGLLLGTLAAAQRDRSYEASTDVRLAQVTSPFRSTDGTRADLSRAVQTQIDVATGDAVRERVRGTAGEDLDVDVALHGERDELRFTARSDDPGEAAEAANAWADAYVAELEADAATAGERYQAALDDALARISREIAVVDAQRATAPPADRPLLDLRRDVLVTEVKALAGRRVLDESAPNDLLGGEVVRRAEAPSEPAGPDALRYLLLGMLGGLVLGYVLACLVEARRDLVRSAEDVGLAAPDEPLLGPVATGPDLASLEELSRGMDYLALRAEVLAVSGDGRPRVLAVLSASGEPEAPSVALGLALALGRQGQRVLLLDADPEPLGSHVLRSLADTPGLAGALSGVPASAAVVMLTGGDGSELLFLPAGQLPVGSLSSAGFAAAVGQLVRDHDLDVVVLAGGAASRSPDAMAVAVLSGSCFVVTTTARTRRKHLALAVRRLEALAPKARAVVLATAPAKQSGRAARPVPQPSVLVGPEPSRPTREGLSGAVPDAP